MGYLHEGHLSLVRCARAENDVVVVSMFINPTQFGPQEDLARYPRDEPRDLALLAGTQTDLVFLPSVEEMYPSPAQIFIDVGEIGARLEGALRPGHYRGVATVVAKLFAIVAPQRAYFGQKDAQQVAVLRQMVRELYIDVDLRVAPVVREADGLAMSSRNVYLSPADRQAATVLSRALRAGQVAYRGGERRAAAIEKAMGAVLASEPRAVPEYARLVDPHSFESPAEATAEALLVLAAWVGSTRLIDAGPLAGEEGAASQCATFS
jgi:pantoate--beta-alanine ligase